MPPFDKAKKLVTGKLKLSFRADKDLTPEDVAAAREYIENYWKRSSVITLKMTRAS